MVEKRLKAICAILQSTFEWAIREHKDNEQLIDYAESRGLIMSDFEKFRFGYCYRNVIKIFEKQHNINKLLPLYKSYKIETPAQIHELISRDLKRMGILKESKKNGQLYCPLAGRMTFPIMNEQGEIVSFAGRKFKESESNSSSPKYINGDATSIYEKSKLLYGYHQFSHLSRKLPFVLVVEGYLDTVALSRVGFINNTALCGVAFSEHQLKMLFEKTDLIMLNLDGDDAGYKNAVKSVIKALPMLNGNRQVRVLFNAPGEDPDSILTNLFNRYQAQIVKVGEVLTPEHEKEIGVLVRSEYSKFLNQNYLSIIDVLKYSVEMEFPEDVNKQRLKMMQFACLAPSGSKTKNLIIRQVQLMERIQEDKIEEAVKHVSQITQQQRHVM